VRKNSPHGEIVFLPKQQMMSVGVKTRTGIGGNRLAPIAAPKAQQVLVGAETIRESGK
jgi:hypothetical protein